MQSREDQARARELYRRGLILSWKHTNLLGIGLSLEKAARSTVVYGQLHQAARLFAVAETLLQSIGFAIEPPDRTDLTGLRKPVRSSVDEISISGYGYGLRLSLARRGYWAEPPSEQTLLPLIPRQTPCSAPYFWLHGAPGLPGPAMPAGKVFPAFSCKHRC